MPTNKQDQNRKGQTQGKSFSETETEESSQPVERDRNEGGRMEDEERQEREKQGSRDPQNGEEIEDDEGLGDDDELGDEDDEESDDEEQRVTQRSPAQGRNSDTEDMRK
jgi:hypothetical protein